MDFLLISPGKYQKHLNLSLPNVCPDVRVNLIGSREQRELETSVTCFRKDHVTLGCFLMWENFM